MMSPETTEKLIKTAAEFADGTCSFMFQGGEPTLAGLDFYRNFLEIEKKYAKKGLRFTHSIQTNGYIIDDEWAEFLSENKFLVGLSLDGPAEIHDFNRTDSAGKGTFNKVMKTARLFDKHRVEYNILAVVTSRNARSAAKVYNFCKKQGFRWLQFIPCLDSFECGEGATDSLGCDEYENFLSTVFNLWFTDLKKGEYISIRHIDNWLSILAGAMPESCAMRGNCSVQFVTEGDGSVYPCDFYVLDELKIGTVGENSFKEMFESENAQKFLRTSLNIPEECKSCPFFCLCRNGCRRERNVFDGKPALNRYCAAYKNFFTKNADNLKTALSLIHKAQNR